MSYILPHQYNRENIIPSKQIFSKLIIIIISRLINITANIKAGKYENKLNIEAQKYQG